MTGKKQGKFFNSGSVIPHVHLSGPDEVVQQCLLYTSKGKAGIQKTAVSTCGSPADKEGLNHPEVQRQGRVNTSWEVSHLLGVHRQTAPASSSSAGSTSALNPDGAQPGDVPNERAEGSLPHTAMVDDVHMQG